MSWLASFQDSDVQVRSEEMEGVNKGMNEEKCGVSLLLAYLARIHFEFPDDLDGDLAVLSLGVSSAVDVAEGSVTHLLDQSPSLQTRIFWEFASALPLLGDDALQYF
jgi:hypothetical protein